MKKRILCTAVCAALWGACLMLPVSKNPYCPVTQAEASESVKEGLVKEEENFRYYEDGQPVTKRWITVNGHTYYFDKNGNASILKCKIDGSYYVFDKEGKLLLPSGKKIVRVETPDGDIQKYYINPRGIALSGWSGGKDHYFDKTGEMVTGIQVINETFYCFSANGKLNRQKTKKIQKAAKYEHPFSSLKKYIGNPKTYKYFDSCYGAGKDGVLTYEGFIVYTYKPGDGTEIFMGAE